MEIQRPFSALSQSLLLIHPYFKVADLSWLFFSSESPLLSTQGVPAVRGFTVFSASFSIPANICISFGSLSYVRNACSCTEVFWFACLLVAVALEELFHAGKKQTDMEIFAVVLMIHEIKQDKSKMMSAYY